MEDYKKLLTDLYKIHDPERIKQIDYFLAKYKGKEKQFYISQKTKYKSKKPISDSKKIIEEALARIKSQSAEKEKPKVETKEKSAIPKENVTKPIEEKKTTPLIIEKKIIEVPPKVKEKTQETIEDTTAPIKPIIIEKEAAKEKDIEEKVAESKSKGPEKTSSASSKPKEDNWPYKNPSRATHQEKDKNFNKKYFLYILGIVLLIIILAVIAFFVFFYSPKKDEKIIEKPKTTITKQPVNAEQKKTSSTKAVVEKETTSQPNAQTTTKKSSTVLSHARITKGDIELPAYFVACYAVKTENHAIKKINELKIKGFDASYYWIPDFSPQGNTYFKVVVGPFTTRIQAMEKLTPVQERAEFDAYVLELK